MTNIRENPAQEAMDVEDVDAKPSPRHCNAAVRAAYDSKVWEDSETIERGLWNLVNSMTFSVGKENGGCIMV